MTRPHVELIRERDLLAEVRVSLMDDTDANEGWGPYLTPEDVRRLERVRLALRAGDVDAASKEAKVFRLTPAA